MATLRAPGYYKIIFLTFLVMLQQGECDKKGCRSCSTVTLESSGHLTRTQVHGAAKVKSMELKDETSSHGAGTCVKGTSFGFIGPDVYVDMGCSGEFEICSVQGRGETIKCSSHHGEPTHCSFEHECDVRSIALLETLHSAPCIEGFSYHPSGSGIKVTKNCRARFSVGCRHCKK